MNIQKSLPCGCPISGHKLTCNVSDNSPLPSPCDTSILPMQLELENNFAILAEKTKLKKLKDEEQQLLMRLELVRNEIEQIQNYKDNNKDNNKDNKN